MHQKDKMEALTWNGGNGLYSRSCWGLTLTSPFCLAYQSPAASSYRCDKMQPLGRPVVPDVYRILAGVLASGVVPVRGRGAAGSESMKSSRVTTRGRCSLSAS